MSASCRGATARGLTSQGGAAGIYTFNVSDFSRLAPDLSDRIAAP